MNDAILEAIDNELALSNRIQSARSTAVSAALNAVMLSASNPAEVAGLSYKIGRLVDGMFARFDFTEAMQDIVDLAGWYKSKAFNADASELLESMSPESRTTLAETAYSLIGGVVAGELIAQLQAKR